MAKMSPPMVRPVPVLGADELRRLLGTCAGRSFEDRRDLALMSFLLDTGARRAEIMGIKLEDVDFDLEVAGVHGNGRRERALRSGDKTALALDRDIRVRARHKHADSPWLWIGQKGGTASGLVMMLRRRSDRAGSAQIHPAPVAPYLRGCVAGPGRQRGRPDAPRRVAITGDDPAVRRVGGGRAGAGRRTDGCH
jgi:integrase/recombinase XerC